MRWLKKLFGSGSTAGPRNPFGVTDVSDPDGADVQAFAASVDLGGSSSDDNASAWMHGTVKGDPESLEGDWAGRWNGASAGPRWVRGSAVIKIVGDRVYILREDSGKFLIDARRVTKDRLVGRSVNVDMPSDS